MSVKTWLQLVGGALACVAIGLTALTLWLYFVIASGLPAERPAEFTFEIAEGGGMLNQSSSYELTNGQLTYTDHYEDSTVTTQFDLSEEELDYFWQILRVQRFDRMRAHEEQGVYDRGGTTMRLNYNDVNISATDAGMTFLNGSSSKRFYAIERELTTLVKPYLDNRMRSVAVKIDPAVAPAVQFVQLNAQVLYAQTGDASGHLSVLPGDYLVSLTTQDGYETSMVTITEASNIVVSGSPDAITVTVEPIL